ncbi:RRXRR domain-containing protein, partial [Limnoraphis robusta]
MFNKRVPVLNPDGSPVMPTKASRARRWVRDGKAKVVQNDLQVFCVQLLEEPTGRETQDISLGIDPGSCFTGVAVQSKRDTLIGLNLNLPKKRVQKRLEERRVLRRTRRGRRIKRSLLFKKRNHRQKRFDNRRQSKLPPSIRANKQLELRVVDELRQLYPIAHAYIERLNKSDSPGFTVAAQGQTFLIKELGKYFPVALVKGWETSGTREWLKLPKSKNKAEQTPNAHVSDAIALASRHFIRYTPNTTGFQTGYQWKGVIQVTPFTFGIVERLPSRPRKMHDLTVQKGGVRDTYGGFDGTHSFKNGDYVEYKTKRSTLKGYISA